MKRQIGIFIALLIFFIQFALIPGASLTWDEPASFFVGRMNLQFWQTGDYANLIDHTNKDRFATSPFTFVKGEEWYPPFPFLVSSAVSYIFAEQLNVMHFIDAHHLGEVIIGAIGVWAFYGLAFELGLPSMVAAGTTILFALYPTIFGQMRDDAKDIPLMSILVVAVYLFIRWIHFWQARQYNKTWIYGFGSAIAFGLAEASKPSAVIIAPILATWFCISIIASRKFADRMRRLPLFVFTSVIVAVIAVGVFIFSWPWLWDNPIVKLTSIWGFFKSVGYNMPTMYLGVKYFAGVNLPKEYPFGILLFQTPLEVTILAVIGVFAVLERVVKKKDMFSFLPLWWFALGMGRFFLPSIIIYARVRHFIDVMPAFFLLTGFGIDAIGKYAVSTSYQAFRSKFIGGLVVVLGVCVVIFHEAWIAKTFYPYEPSYFNFLVGGSKNVAEKELFDIEYWGAGVKEAMEYLNFQSFVAPIAVYSCGLRHMTMYYNAPKVKLLWVNPEDANYSIVPNAASWFGDMVRFSRANHRLVYTIKRGGADLFYVFQNTNGQGWRCGYETIGNDASLDRTKQ
jgi:hypothetical protein